MEQKGFFGSLFDFSFTSLVTSKLISILYVLAIIGIGVYALFLIVAGFSRGAAIGVLAIIGAALFFLLTVIYTRVLLEVLIVIFRIHEHVAEIALQRSREPVTPSAPAVGQSPSNYPAP